MGATIVVLAGAAAFLLLRHPFSCPEGMDAHKDGAGFGICSPASWETDTDLMQTEWAALAPEENGGFRNNLNVVVTPAGETTLDEAIRDREAALPSSLEGYRKVSSRDGELDGVPSSVLVYDFRQGGYQLRGEQTMAIHGGKAYFITYTAQVGHESATRTDADRIVATFRFL